MAFDHVIISHVDLGDGYGGVWARKERRAESAGATNSAEGRARLDRVAGEPRPHGEGA